MSTFSPTFDALAAAGLRRGPGAGDAHRGDGDPVHRAAAGVALLITDTEGKFAKHNILQQ